VHSKFDTGAGKNLWRAALWPPLSYSKDDMTNEAKKVEPMLPKSSTQNSFVYNDITFSTNYKQNYDIS